MAKTTPKLEVETTKNAHPDEIAFSMTRELFNKMIVTIMNNWPAGSRVLFMAMLKVKYCYICGGIKDKYKTFGGCGCEEQAKPKPKQASREIPVD